MWNTLSFSSYTRLNIDLNESMSSRLNIFELLLRVIALSTRDWGTNMGKSLMKYADMLDILSTRQMSSLLVFFLVTWLVEMLMNSNYALLCLRARLFILSSIATGWSMMLMSSSMRILMDWISSSIRDRSLLRMLMPGVPLYLTELKLVWNSYFYFK